MKGAALIWRNAAQFKKDLDAVETKRVKAAHVATKKEGFRLRGKLQSELASSRPGNARLAPYSQIARRKKSGDLKKNARKPLAGMKYLIRYKAEKTGKNLNVAVGFVHPKMKRRGWEDLVNRLQEGGVAYDRARKLKGAWLANIGARLLKRGQGNAAKFFFLKKTTRGAMRLPARPVIDPFIRANMTEALRNIERDWERKMAGERI